MNILGKFLLLGCALFSSQPMVASDDLKADYIVVGLGAAGAGVVKLLSDAHYSVIALEAGANHDQDEPIKNSTFALSLEEDFFPQYFYQVQEIPQVFADNKEFNYTTGRLFGGGSSINGEQYVRGSTPMYDQWQALLGSPWTTNDILDAFIHLEKYNGLTPNPAERGFHGPVDVRQAPVTPTTMASKFVSATTQATGFPEILDYNCPQTPLGPFTRWQLFQQSDGRRESSSTAYLKHFIDSHSSKHDKVNILAQATVLRVIIDGDKAVGVKFLQHGKFGEAFAKKGVILSAGIFTPQLLMLSGIGPKSTLEAADVHVVVDNPNVGLNLANNFISSAVFSANPNDVGVPADDPNALFVGGAFLPDPSPNSDASRRGVQLIGVSPESETFVIAINTIQPKSRGFVQIQSKDPLQIPLTSDGVFSNPADLQTFKSVFQVYIQDIAAQLAAIDPQYQLLVPSPDVINDDALLEDYIIQTLDHAHHWTGSCRMAPQNQGGVVDKHARVYGVKHLFVADDTIAPFVPDGNTAAPAFMIARVVAKDIIKRAKRH